MPPAHCLPPPSLSSCKLVASSLNDAAAACSTAAFSRLKALISPLRPGSWMTSPAGDADASRRCSASSTLASTCVQAQHCGLIMRGFSKADCSVSVATVS